MQQLTNEDDLTNANLNDAQSPSEELSQNLNNSSISSTDLNFGVVQHQRLNRDTFDIKKCENKKKIMSLSNDLLKLYEMLLCECNNCTCCECPLKEVFKQKIEKIDKKIDRFNHKTRLGYYISYISSGWASGDYRINVNKQYFDFDSYLLYTQSKKVEVLIRHQNELILDILQCIPGIEEFLYPTTFLKGEELFLNQLIGPECTYINIPNRSIKISDFYYVLQIVDPTNIYSPVCFCNMFPLCNKNHDEFFCEKCVSTLKTMETNIIVTKSAEGSADKCILHLGRPPVMYYDTGCNFTHGMVSQVYSMHNMVSYYSSNLDELYILSSICDRGVIYDPQIGIVLNHVVSDPTNAILEDFSDNVTNGITSFHNTAATILENFSDNITGNVVKIRDLIETNIQSVKETTHSSRVDVTKAVIAAIIVSMIYFGTRSQTKRTIILETAGLLALVYLGKDVVTEWIGKKKEEDPEIYDSQGGVIDLGKIITGVGAYLYFNNFDTTKEADYTKLFKKAALEYPKISSNIFEMISSVAKCFIQILRDYTGLDKDHQIYQWFSAEPLHIIEWANAVTTFSQGVITGKTRLDIPSYESFVALQARGNAISAEVMSLPDSARLRSYITDYLRELNSLKDRFASVHLFNEGPRCVPVSLCLFGRSGVGKTSACFPIAHDVAKLTMSPDELALFQSNKLKLLYPMNAENVYMDDYDDQFACLIDEFGQSRDQAGNPDNEWMKLIRAHNSFPWNMHCAEMCNKNKKFFKSKLLILSTNLAEFKPTSIVSTEAIYRRIDFPTYVCPKPEFSINPEVGPLERRLDETKLQAGNFQTEIYEFHEVEFDRLSLERRFTGRVYDYDRLVREISRKIDRNKLRHIHYINSMGSRFKNWKAETTYVQQGYFDDLLDESNSEHMTDTVSMNVGLVYQAIESYLDVQGLLFNRENMVKCIDFLGDYLSEVKAVPEDKSHRITASVYGRTLVQLNKMDWPLQTPPEIEASCSFREYFSKYVCEIRTKFSIAAERVTRANVYIKALTVVTAIASATYLISNLVGKGEQKVIAESILHGQESNNKDEEGSLRKPRSKRPRKRGNCVVRNVHNQEGGYDLQAAQISETICRGNCYHLFGPTGNKLGSVTFIKGVIAMFPKHFYSYILSKADDATFTLEKYENNRVYKYDVFNFKSMPVVQFDDSDLVVVSFPNNMPNHKDLTKFFVDWSYIERHDQMSVFLVLKDENKFKYMYSKAVYSEGQAIRDTVTGEVNAVSGLIKYNAPTKEGDCGALCMVNDSGTSCKKILGIHVAGMSNGSGLSTFVDSDLIDEALSKLPGQITVLETAAYTQQAGEISRLPISVLGVVAKPMNLPYDTNIRRSKLHGAWGPARTAPVKFREHTLPDGSSFVPMDAAISKYNYNTSLIDNNKLTLAVAGVFEDIEIAAKDSVIVSKKILSYEEAVRGIPGMTFYGGVNRHTSSGYPWCEILPKNSKGKTSIWGLDNEYEFGNKYDVLVKSSVDRIIEHAKIGTAISVIYKDFIKDERYPLAKLAKGKSRLVSGAPVDYVVAFRMYFMDFMSMCMENRIYNGLSVGVNPFGDDWDVLSRLLAKYKDNIIAGDYSNFDGGLLPQMAKEIVRYINLWYSDGSENAQIREVLFHYLYNSTHINGDLIYCWDGSLPSGHPFTAVMNSIVGRVLTRLSWIDTFGAESYGKFYRDNVVDIQYGDDNVIAVSNLVASKFDQSTLTDCLAKFGYTYTDDVKSGQARKLRGLHEVQFLKRQFRWEPTLMRYVAPLNFDTIYEMSYWIKSKTHAESITHDTFMMAMHELSMHTLELWSEWAPKFLEGYKEEFGSAPILDRVKLLFETTSMNFLETFTIEFDE